jgi:protein gp37
MADRSPIEWTQATWNPTTGCDRVSAGCDNCYALTLAARLKAMGSAKYQADGDPRTSGPGFALTLHPVALHIPRRWREPRTIFVNSMSDLFHAKVPLSFVRDVFTVIADTPQHTYQMLTKRARRLRRLATGLEWPPNLWVGVSVEDNTTLDRVDDLRHVPAAIRFLSCEPLLGPLDGLGLDGIDWVIAGGESGRDARPPDPDWIRHLRDLTREAGVPFFFKQWGGRTAKSGGRLLDGRTWDQYPRPGSARRRRGEWLDELAEEIPAGAVVCDDPVLV